MYLFGRKITLHPKLPQFLFFGLITILLAFALTRITLLARAQNAIQAPLFNTSIGLSFLVEHLTFSKARIARERNEFQKIAADLAMDRSLLNELEDRTKELESLLEYENSTPYTTTAARIIARSEAGMSTVVINKGAQDSIEKGFAVVIENGHLVGVVEEVKITTSIVRLLESPESQIPATILGTTQTAGLIEGQQGFLVKMRYIPQDVTIDTSNVVVTSGLDGYIPAGLVIGTVESIQRNETATFQEAYVRPFYDPSEYAHVLVLNPLQ